MWNYIVLTIDQKYLTIGSMVVCLKCLLWWFGVTVRAVSGISATCVVLVMIPRRNPLDWPVLEKISALWEFSFSAKSPKMTLLLQKKKLLKIQQNIKVVQKFCYIVLVEFEFHCCCWCERSVCVVCRGSSMGVSAGWGLVPGGLAWSRLAPVGSPLVCLLATTSPATGKRKIASYQQGSFQLAEKTCSLESLFLNVHICIAKLTLLWPFWWIEHLILLLFTHPFIQLLWNDPVRYSWFLWQLCCSWCSQGVLKIMTICHARDLWKLSLSCKQLYLLCLHR